MIEHGGRFDELNAPTRVASQRRDTADSPRNPAPAVFPLPNGGTRPDSLPVTVRYIRLGDVPRLRRLDPLHILDRPESTVQGWRPLRGALASATPGGRDRRPAFVVEAGDRLVGYARFQTTAPDGRWTLVALGAAMGVYDAEPVWEALLSTAVRQAGLRGVRSLFARIPWGVGASPLMSRLGWQPYATETLFLAHDVRGAWRDAMRPRPMKVSDTWSVHQLYAAAVPTAVQQAEAFTSRRWESAARGAKGRSAGLLFEDGPHLVGFARVTTGPGGRALDVLVHPERREVAGRMLDGALAALAPGGGRIWATLRGYQDELASPLQDRGFQPVFEQELFVRYTTARVRQPAPEPAPFALDVRERAARQVPSFLAGAPDDRTAP